MHDPLAAAVDHELITGDLQMITVDLLMIMA
jgi:hypothetical protein